MTRDKITPELVAAAAEAERVIPQAELEEEAAFVRLTDDLRAHAEAYASQGQPRTAALLRWARAMTAGLVEKIDQRIGKLEARKAEGPGWNEYCQIDGGLDQLRTVRKWLVGS